MTSGRGEVAEGWVRAPQAFTLGARATTQYGLFTQYNRGLSRACACMAVCMCLWNVCANILLRCTHKRTALMSLKKEVTFKGDTARVTMWLTGALQGSDYTPGLPWWCINKTPHLTSCPQSNGASYKHTDASVQAHSSAGKTALPLGQLYHTIMFNWKDRRVWIHWHLGLQHSGRVSGQSLQQKLALRMKQRTKPTQKYK